MWALALAEVNTGSCDKRRRNMKGSKGYFGRQASDTIMPLLLSVCPIPRRATPECGSGGISSMLRDCSYSCFYSLTMNAFMTLWCHLFQRTASTWMNISSTHTRICRLIYLELLEATYFSGVLTERDTILMLDVCDEEHVTIFSTCTTAAGGNMCLGIAKSVACHALPDGLR